MRTTFTISAYYDGSRLLEEEEDRMVSATFPNKMMALCIRRTASFLFSVIHLDVNDKEENLFKAQLIWRTDQLLYTGVAQVLV